MKKNLILLLFLFLFVNIFFFEKVFVTSLANGEDIHLPEGAAEEIVDKTPKLLITEVFLKEGEEFIEIKNIGENVFKGTLMLQRTKTIKQVFEAEIPSNSYLILTKSSNLDYERSIPLNLEFPKGSFGLSLLFNQETIDSVKLTKGQIEKAKQINASLEREIETSGTFIPTIVSRSITHSGGYLINPGYSFGENMGKDEKLDWNGVLVLTEIFFHKDNSWFEVTNYGDEPFHGNIAIDGLNKKKFEYNVEIPSKSSLVIAENDRYLAQDINFKTTKDDYSFSWKGDFEAKLYYGRDKVDTLFVHQDWVKKIKDSDVSFQKVLDNGKWITTKTNLDQKKNVRGTFVANPGVYFVDQENTKDIAKAIEKEVEDSDGSLVIQECGDIDDNVLEIQEVFGGNQVYSPFIEIKILDTPKSYQQFKISGSFLEEEIIIDKNENIDLWKIGQTFLISNTNRRDESLIDHIVDNNLNFKNQAGELKIEGLNGQKRQLLDTTLLTAFPVEKSIYFQGNKKQCQRIFDSSGDFSPGFDRKFLKFFQIDTTPKIEYIYVNKGGGGGGYSCPTKEDLCPTPSSSSDKNKDIDKKVEKSEIKEELVPSTDNQKEEKNYGLKIEDVLFDPPGSDKDKESISLLLTKGGELDLKETTLVINGKRKKITGILKEGISQTFIGNFGFPNTSKDGSLIKVEILFGDQILDTFYYNIQVVEKKNENKDGLKVFSVLDGDTLRYRDEYGKLQSVRLLGVDSPESNTARYKKVECFGKEAKEYLIQRLKGKQIRIESDTQAAGKDRYGRSLAYVYLDDVLINAELIAKGYAKEYTFKADYDKQSTFKSLEAQAKKEKIGMRNPLSCPDNAQLKEEKIFSNLILKIINIDYDPKGSDQGKERFTISSYDKSGKFDIIDFTQHFSLFIFDKTTEEKSISLDEFEYGKGKFVDLSFLGNKHLSDEMVLEGTFNFPNTKSSCIALVQKDHIFDIACYDINKEKKEESIGLLSGSIKILSVLPNPKGKDIGKEQIELLYHGEEREIDLNQDYFLLINGKIKKKLNGILEIGTPKNITGNFSFPNASACVELWHEKIKLDQFCYVQEKEGTIIGETVNRLENLSNDDLRILKELRLKKYGSEICLVYQKEKLQCRKLPKTRIDPQLKREVKFYKSVLKTFETELRKKYSALFYQTEFLHFFKLLKQARSSIKNGNRNYEISQEVYDRSEFGKIYEKTISQNFFNRLYQGFFGIIPQKVIENYKEKEQQRRATLEN